MSAKPMTKKEWNEYLAKTWEEAVESTYQDMIDEAVKAEREACAKLCEDSWMAFSRTPNRRLDITPFPELEYVAKVIRARGQA